jgi:hypothetical protein
MKHASGLSTDGLRVSMIASSVEGNYTGNRKKGQQKNPCTGGRASDPAARGKAKDRQSDILSYSPDDLGDQLLEIELQLYNVGRQAFLETVLALLPEKKAVNDVLHLDFQTAEQFLGCNKPVFHQDRAEFFKTAAFFV